MEYKEIQAIARLVAQEIKAHAIWNKWMTVKEACDYAKVSRNTMMRWVNRGYVYGTKTTGDWRIDRESLDAYFNFERA